MTTRTTKQQGDGRAVTVDARSKFGIYAIEDRKCMRKIEVKECDTFAKIRIAWDRWKYEAKKYPDDDQNKYDITDEFLCGLCPSAVDVKRFVDVLIDSQHEKENEFEMNAGIFLSALVNRGCDEEYEIDTSKFDELIQCLGYKNCKKLRIHGNAGMFVGTFMGIDGHITVDGDANNVGTSLAGGTIIIKGNVRDVGELMGDGTIEVYGTLSGEIGSDMIDGTIIAHNGMIGYISSNICGGIIRIDGGRCPEIPNDNNFVAIYHNGICIADGQGDLDD